IHELTPPPNDEAASRWLHGRAAEVERFIESVVEDHTTGRIDSHAALAGLQRYLDALHSGLAVIVRASGNGATDPAAAAGPSCCRPPRPRRSRKPPPRPLT
ncbi:MAG: hypothetical protein ACRENE_12250, partial [Polyangiaceae bacterium]